MRNGFISGDSVLKHQEESNREIFFLGLVANYILWGVQIAQSYRYYKYYRKTDRTWVKAAVGLLCVTEAAQSICTSASSWRFLIEALGDLPGDEQYLGWGGDVIPFLDAFTASIVHCFYAHKIWMLLSPPYKHICTVIVLTMSCLQFAAGTGCTIFMFSINITILELRRFKSWACIWLVTAAVTDVVITALMTQRLSSGRSGIKNTDDVVSKLIRLIVETGLATAMVQIVDVMLYLIWPLESYHVIAALVGPKVYSNAMLALLNSRKRPRKASMIWDPFRGTPLEDMNVHATRTDGFVDENVSEKLPSSSTRHAL